MVAFDGFASALVPTAEAAIFVRWAGRGPGLLLLHGFPETHAMWHDVAPRLSAHFTVVCADLRGYGQSACPPSTPDHAPYSKRAMARDLVEVMAHLGFASFAVAGHDRGARVGYRMALDHGRAVERLAMLDVVPIWEAWQRADARLTTSFWPWSLLAQPAPLPERLLAGAPEAVVEDALGGGWGTPAQVFAPALREAYVRALRRPDVIHAICEEFRAAATVDVTHDADDRRAGRRIGCPVLVLWSQSGPLGQWYGDAGGPLGLWRNWADDVRGHAVPGGHFFPEEDPEGTAATLASFFDASFAARPLAGARS